MPWKNGGGTTYEILTEPAGSGFDEFRLRLSMAVVATSGPFSTFSEIDRTLTVIAGEMKLSVAQNPVVVLSANSDPYRFSGDEAASAELSGSAVLDFNVMTRRWRGRHAVARLIATGSSIAYQRQSAWTAIFAACERIRVSPLGAGNAELGLHDLLVLTDDAAPPLTIDAQGDGSALIVEYWPQDSV